MTDFLQSDPAWIFGPLSSLLSCVAFWPYIRNTLAGRTAPQRASWLIWSVLATVALASQFADGATQSLWFAATQTGATVLIFLLAIRRGRGVFLARGDVWTLALAGLGLWLWCVTREPGFALVIGAAVGLIGGVPTLIKAFRAPRSETFLTWFVGAAAACLALFAAGGDDPMLIVYPAYLLALYTAICVAMALGLAVAPQRRLISARY